MTYYSLGKWIVEVQQEGQDAQYGKKVIKTLSEHLMEKFGRDFSKANLEFFRRFYLNYEDRIAEIVFRQFAIEKTETVFRQLEEKPPFVVMRIKNKDERIFYEIESAKSGWGIRTLQRQYNSSLYERLALSRDKDAVMQLAKEGNVIDRPYCIGCTASGDDFGILPTHTIAYEIGIFKYNRKNGCRYKFLQKELWPEERT